MAGIISELPKEWDGALVRKWLESRVVAARSDQAAAERYGWDRRDDCDVASAEEMVCTLLKTSEATSAQSTFLDELKRLLDRDAYVWRGVYDDARFDRHAKAYIRKLVKMAKANAGFEKTGRYQ